MVSEETGQPHQSEILKSMQRIAEILSGHSSFGDKCDSVLRILVDLMPADLATLRRPDETGNDMVLVGRAAKLGFEYEPPAVVRNQRLISYQSYQDKEIHLSNDYASNPEAYQVFLDIGVQSCAFPPIGSQGAFFGLIYIISKEAGFFTPERVQLLSTIKDSLGVLFENADLYEKINQELDQTRKTQAALSESEARFRTLVENTADILWEMDPPWASTPTAAPMPSQSPGTDRRKWWAAPNTISCHRTNRNRSGPFSQIWLQRAERYR